MDAVTALFASAAVLLVIAGLVKVVRPTITATLLDDLGVPTTGALDGTWLTRVLGGLPFGVGPGDPVTFAAVGATLLATAALATWLPVRRAARVDPAIPLRCD